MTTRGCSRDDCWKDRALQPNSDIAGNGVVIGFIGTGYLVVILLVVHYFLTFDPSIPPPSGNCIASMCDIQSITGISILTGGYLCLNQSLSAHHWVLIVNLAWFSSITHLSGLTMLRRHFQNNPLERLIRMILMFTLLIMLIAAMIPTRFFNWELFSGYGRDQPSAARRHSPAICFFSATCGRELYQMDYDTCINAQQNDLTDSTPLCSPILETTHAYQGMVFTLALLLTGFISRTVKLSDYLSAAVNRWISRPLELLMQNILTRLDQVFVRTGFPDFAQILWSEIFVRPLLAISILVKLHVHLFNSVLGEVRSSISYGYHVFNCTANTSGDSIALLADSVSTTRNIKYQDSFSG
ncbi:hypothetical protein CCHR01_15849 [Colletotrichum chrysophilum]|uniref:Uncharacterized protein n=1 Tax=Colletotrichum chrysophilum TaxID=1836956 RepID=A0AAD9A9P5_9PEZI|nr:hypothetical protein CCHR01_15849 [Colletotrichum chrysophilum]